MARCPKCGYIWSCSQEEWFVYVGDDVFSPIDPDYPHCRKCRCPTCRKKTKGIKPILLDDKDIEAIVAL